MLEVQAIICFPLSQRKAKKIEQPLSMLSVSTVGMPIQSIPFQGMNQATLFHVKLTGTRKFSCPKIYVVNYTIS